MRQAVPTRGQPPYSPAEPPWRKGRAAVLSGLRQQDLPHCAAAGAARGLAQAGQIPPAARQQGRAHCGGARGQGGGAAGGRALCQEVGEGAEGEEEEGGGGEEEGGGQAGKGHGKAAGGEEEAADQARKDQERQRRRGSVLVFVVAPAFSLAISSIAKGQVPCGPAAAEAEPPLPSPERGAGGGQLLPRLREGLQHGRVTPKTRQELPQRSGRRAKAQGGQRRGR